MTLNRLYIHIHSLKYANPWKNFLKMQSWHYLLKIFSSLKLMHMSMSQNRKFIRWPTRLQSYEKKFFCLSKIFFLCKVLYLCQPYFRVDIADASKKKLVNGFVESVKSLELFTDKSHEEKSKEFRQSNENHVIASKYL